MTMQPKEQIFARMYVVATLIALFPVLIAFQVARISVVQGPELRERMAAQSTSFEQIPAMRGRIVDAAGRNLAVNVRRYTVGVDPTVKTFQENRNRAIDRMASLMDMSRSEVERRIRQRSSPKYAVLATNMVASTETIAELRTVPGISLSESFTRQYSHGTTASHVLGHVNTDLKGIAGLEMQYDEWLSGTPGRRALRKDRRRNLSYDTRLDVVEPTHGESIHLTIDLVRQEIMEQELEKGVLSSGANWGVAIAMDPHTGAILAMANYPTYDPNQAGRFGTFERRNHAINDLIEPGSTFKLIASVAALESGVVALTDTVDTGRGSEYRYGYELRDTHALGKVSFLEVIQESSNIGMAQVAERLDKGVLYRYARDFGFDQPTWIDLPGETSGRVKRPDSWSRTTAGAMSRGYEIQSTPLQMLVAYAALANGGVLVTPHVVKERRDVLGNVTWQANPDSVRRAFKRSTAELIRPAFEAVVDSGTATQARIEGVRVAGKTGTASKYVNGAYSRSDYRATFAGFFPADHPKVAMIVIMDEPSSSIYGGAVSAPVFRAIGERWLATSPELTPQPVMVDVPRADTILSTPSVEGMPAAVASRVLRANGFRPRDVDRPDEIVGDASTSDRRPVDIGTRVRLVTDSDAAPVQRVMPDVTGLGARDAARWLERLGVAVRLQGRGRVSAQWPAPGAKLPAEAALTLK
jgi:cell division protein FtsI (penicillin-binding protein 3)